MFSQIYSVQAIPLTFIHKIVELTLASSNNCLDKYYRRVGETIDSAKDAFIHPEVTFPDANATWPTAERDAHVAFVNVVLLGHSNRFFDFLKAETFINGLPQIDYDRLKNKVAITTANEMYEYLIKVKYGYKQKSGCRGHRYHPSPGR